MICGSVGDDIVNLREKLICCSWVIVEDNCVLKFRRIDDIVMLLLCYIFM